MKIPGPRFECEDGEGTYFCMGRECEDCYGTGRVKLYVWQGNQRGVAYHDSCERCDGEGWWLYEVEGQQAIIEARAEDLLCLPPSAVCAGVERHPHELGCQAIEHEVALDQWLWNRRLSEGRGLLDYWPSTTDKLAAFRNYRGYFHQALRHKVCT